MNQRLQTKPNVPHGLRIMVNEEAAKLEPVF